MRDESHIKLGLRVKKTKAYPFGWQYMEQIPPDEPCILALPGSDADNSKKANGFAKMIEDTLKDKKIPIYSVEYTLAGRLSVADREAMLIRFKQGNPNSPLLRYRKENYGYIPNYIRELYKMVLAPRLRDENGNRISIGKAAQRLNMLTFVNHCQGSTVSFQMERLLEDDMKSLGYQAKSREYLFKQVHNVDIAPVIPYGLTKTTTFKFISFADEKVTSVTNPQTKYILQRKKEHEEYLAEIKNTNKSDTKKSRPFTMNFSLFRPTGNETIFAVNNMYPLEIQKDKDFDGIEHTFDTYSEKDDDDRTKQGDQLSQTFHDIINWLVEYSKKNAAEFCELPDIFKEPRFSKIIARTQNNRYDFITREIKTAKARRNKTAVQPPIPHSR